MAILSKVIYRFKLPPPHQTTIDVLHRIGEKYLKRHMESKKSPRSQDDPKEKTNKAEGIMLPNFKLQDYSNQNSMVLVPKQK